jgi:hypothetical protein
MSKKLAGVLMAVLFATAAVYAGDVWKDKDFEKWDQKDVDKILKDSPWSKQIQYGGGATGGMDAPFTQPASESAHPDINNGSRLSASAGTGGSAGMGPATSFFVRWYSSRTVREAMARQRELKGTPTDETRKGLATDMETYEIVLQSTNLNAFSKEGEASLKEHSYLMLKANKDKIPPSRVIVQKGQDDRAVAVVFDFPRKSASGEPTIGTSEKGVEFYTKAGGTPLTVSFDLSKMADKKGQDY